jgi:hypothetical protein
MRSGFRRFLGRLKVRSQSQDVVGIKRRVVNGLRRAELVWYHRTRFRLVSRAVPTSFLDESEPCISTSTGLLEDILAHTVKIVARKMIKKLQSQKAGYHTICHHPGHCRVPPHHVPRRQPLPFTVSSSLQVSLPGQEGWPAQPGPRARCLARLLRPLLRFSKDNTRQLSQGLPCYRNLCTFSSHIRLSMHSSSTNST